MNSLNHKKVIKVLSSLVFLIVLLSLINTELSAFQSNWSDPESWGGTKPIDGDEVTIPEGVTILLDENTPLLSGLIINGSLVFSDQNLTLTSDWILVTGSLEIGSEESPFIHNATIILTADDTEENIMGMGTRGIMVMGGSLQMYGSPPETIWTKINAHAEAGETALVLMQSVDWVTNNEIVIAPTDYYEAAEGASISQRVSITSASGTDINISEGLNAFRWGRLQYVTNSGLSLDPADLVTPPLPDTGLFHTPVVLDQRATIGNLTRNISIQAPDDNLWNDEGFGVHLMIMGEGAFAQMNGVEIKRGGQAGRIRRYPVHWHMLSYEGTQTLDDATGQYIRNSVINSSANRGIVIHGTNGLLIQNNIVYDILGHGIFTEDAVERRNTIDGNLVLHVRNQSPQNALKLHETGVRGASCFWLSNPDNTITNNIAADCGTNGFWLAFPEQPWGESINVLHEDGLLLNPSRLRFGIFDNNTAHSNSREGIMIDFVEISNEGSVSENQYISTTDGREVGWPYSTLRRFLLSNYKTWKNGHQGIWDRAVWADNFGAVSADNAGRYFAGSGANGVIERTLAIGTSLNHLMNGTDRRTFTHGLGGTQIPTAFATYHSTFDIKNNILVNFPLVEGTRSGVFATDDYYIRPVDKGHVRNTGNVFINSHPGARTLPPTPYFTLAGALWDPHGNWGIPGSNNYLVYNNSFFTYGQTPQIPSPGLEVGGVIVNGPFYGINDFVVNRSNEQFQDLMALSISRLDEEYQEIGTWDIDAAPYPTVAFGHMRHFAAHKQGIYRLGFPDFETVSDVTFTIENMLTSQDTLVMAVEYSGSFEVSQVYSSTFWNIFEPNHEQAPTFSRKHVFEELANQEAVLSSNIESYWHDVENDLVWMKIIGGIEQGWNDEDYDEFSDERLYRKFRMRIFGSELPVNNETLETDIPTDFSLSQNYPNPFNPSTNIEFSVPEKANIQIEVFDIAGRLIEVLFNGEKNAGIHSVTWDAGSHSSGIYLLRMHSPRGIETRKMILLK